MPDSDFEFYGEEYNEEQVDDIKGITDKVTSYTYTGMDYPCMVIKESFVCPKHRMLVIKNMVKKGEVEKDISLYYAQGTDLFKLGMLSSSQVKVFIEMVGVDNLEGYLSEKEGISGDMLYILYAQASTSMLY